MVQQALKESTRIQPGTSTRKDVEKAFREEGGLQFPGKGFYSYRDCSYIKLEVEYAAPALITPGRLFFSPDDKVKTVSKLSVNYPTMD